MFEDHTDLFADERVLKPSWSPDHLIDRDQERAQIRDALQPAASGDPPDHVLVTGPVGSGKTASLRDVFEQLSEERRLDTLWVNCGQYDTRAAVLTRIASDLGEVRSKRGYAGDYLLSRISQWLEYDRDHNLVIALDEVDWLAAPDQLLQDLHRLGFQGDAAVGLALVTCADRDALDWSGGTWSKLGPRHVPFDSYDTERLREIAVERVQDAFRDGVVPEAAVNRVVELAGDDGDCRRVFGLLRRAGRRAEADQAEGVTVEHVEAAHDPDRFGG